MVGGTLPSTPMTSVESVRPTIEGRAGPATTRVTRRSGSVRGGAPRVWRGTLNWVSRAVGPASAARPHAARPRSAGCPQAASSSAPMHSVRLGMPEDNSGPGGGGRAGSGGLAQGGQCAAEVEPCLGFEASLKRGGLEQWLPSHQALEHLRATGPIRGLRHPAVLGADATVVAVEQLDGAAENGEIDVAEELT